MAAWRKRWDNSKIPNCEKLTLSAQTSSALQTILLCQTSFIEDLLSDGFKFVLTIRFQSDSIERKFGQYCHINGGRFLVELKDAIWSERILKIQSLANDTHREKLLRFIQLSTRMSVWLLLTFSYIFTQSIKFYYTFYFHVLKIQMFEKCDSSHRQ